MTWTIFWETSFGRQLYSFIKTYVTVFLAIYLALFNGQPEGASITLFDMAAIAPAAKWAFISVLRNVYKMLTES